MKRGPYFKLPCKAHKAAHQRKIEKLVSLGWTKIGGYWINPRSHIKYTESVAIAIEEMRGTFGSRARLNPQFI